jgi:hypothetical protein
MVHVVSPDEGEVIQLGPIRLRIIEVMARYATEVVPPR